MSLVIGYNAPECQIWCCDGLTVYFNQGRLEQVTKKEKKIRSIPNSKILCGWVGEKYDAEFIIKGISFRPSISLNEFLRDVANRCHQVNDISCNKCEQSNQIYCPTGLLIGGFLPGRQFLSVVSPDGQIQKHKMFGAIGIGSEIAQTKLSGLHRHHLSALHIFDKLIDCLTKAFSEFDQVGGSVYWAFLKQNSCVELFWPDIDNQQMHSRGLETLRRFLL